MVMKEKGELETHYASVNESKDILKVVDAKLEELIEDKRLKMKQLESNKILIR